MTRDLTSDLDADAAMQRSCLGGEVAPRSGEVITAPENFTSPELMAREIEILRREKALLERELDLVRREVNTSLSVEGNASDHIVDSRFNVRTTI